MHASELARPHPSFPALALGRQCAFLGGFGCASAGEKGRPLRTGGAFPQLVSPRRQEGQFFLDEDREAAELQPMQAFGQQAKGKRLAHFPLSHGQVPTLTIARAGPKMRHPVGDRALERKRCAEH